MSPCKHLQYAILIVVLICGNAMAWSADDVACAMSCNKNMVCVAYDHHIDLIDWTEIDKPRKIGSCAITGKEWERCGINDVAITDQYVYVALEGYGLCVVSIENPQTPKIVNGIGCELPEDNKHHFVSVYSLRMLPGMLFLARYDGDGNKELYCYSLKNPKHPVLLKESNDIIRRLAVPFPEWDDVDRFTSQYMQFVDVKKINHGYFVRTFGNRLDVHIFGNRLHKTTLNLMNVNRDVGEIPVTRALADDAVITLGARLWLLNLKDGSIVASKDFDSHVHVMGMTESWILLGEEGGKCKILDRKLNQIGLIQEASEFSENFMGSEYVIVKPDNSNNTYRTAKGGEKLLGFTLSAKPDRLKLPFETWAGDMKWIYKHGGVFLGCKKGWNRVNGVIEIADCKNLNDIKITGKIEGIKIAPKGVYFHDNRMYVLDAGDYYIEEDNWKTYHGTPKVIDIQSAECPRIISLQTEIMP